MARPVNPWLAQKKDQIDQMMRLQREFTRQQCLDMALITLNEDFQFGPERCQRFMEKFEETFEAYAETTLKEADGDDTMSYVKGNIDRKIAYILGDKFVPFEERYPGCKAERKKK